MPTVIETSVYQFDELGPDAKEKAREWFRQGNCDDSFWSECVIEDAKECAKIIGIEIDQIYWSGFWSQGDGACFTGEYSYAKGAAKAIRQHAPQGEELHRIASDLQALQRRNFYQLSARSEHRHNHCHEHSVHIDVYRDGSDSDADTEESLKDLLRDFMRWIYKRLESEWEYQNSDEQVDDAIRANEYTFTEDGERT